jgi:anti-sigma factor (TIGR02949 family)
MISCRVVRRHVDAHVDGELDTTTQVEFDSHLASCPHCRDEAAFTQAIKAETKRALGGTRAPEALRLRLLSALEQAPPLGAQPLGAQPLGAQPGGAQPGGAQQSSDASEGAEASRPPLSVEATPARPAKPRRRGYLVAARYVVPAAAAAVVFAAFATRSDERRVGTVAEPLFEDVVRRHASEYPVEVRGSAPEVSGWFRGRLDFQARPVVFEGDSQARLVGGRLSNVREQEAAAFYYDVHGRRVTVMVFEPPRDAMRSGAERVQVGDRELYYRQVHGYTVPFVERDGLTYAFTGDLDSQSMIQLAATAQPAH